MTTMSASITDESIYMERALQIARNGMGNTSPNPMVGAVITDPTGRIIGEGYHRRCGEGHAEVNAVASVAPADHELLKVSTMYVTLEPCSHYGKTPPCAQLIIDRHIPAIVVGSLDPFEKVSGRGVAMLREAGVDVTVLEGPLSDRCRELNRRFFTAHTMRRPFITLKWAQSADGHIDAARASGEGAYRFSTPLSTLLVHRLRSLHDAILVGSGTFIADKPRLDVRGWEGRSPQRIVLDRRGRVTPTDTGTTVIHDDLPLAAMLARLYGDGITSVLVEGGREMLQSFIDQGLWDDARVEVSPARLGDRGSVKAPRIDAMPCGHITLPPHTVYLYSNNI